MAHPISFTSKDITRLFNEKEPLVELLNRLMRLEATALGMLPTDVDTSLRTDNPDGGVDARTRNAPIGSQWIPPGLTVWQSKSGKCPDKAGLKKELMLRR